MEIQHSGARWRLVPFSSFLDRDIPLMTWSFGRLGGAPYSKHVRLLGHGRVGGYFHPNEHSWTIDGVALSFRHEDGSRMTLFDRCYVDDQGKLLLVGHFLPSGHANLLHFLEERSEPYSIARDPSKFRIDRHFEGPRRRNLVIMGANESSLHHEWAQNIDNGDRNWDLCLSFYGAPQNYPPSGPVEYTSLQTGVRKWLAIYSAMYEGSPFWGYERIFVMDDDIRTSWRDINRFLEICRDLDLLLAQPSLKPGCFITHPITEQRPDCLVRFTTFVEAMAPCFSREAMRLCIACTAGGFYGFGIDHLWPRMIGMPRNRMAIVDAVAVEHTRPIGTNYQMNLALDEERHLYKLYQMGGHISHQEVGRLSL